MSKDITLPPLPGALVDVETEARAYARAAVEADRQNHFRDAAKMVPSDDEIVALSREMLATARTDNMIAFVRALLSRYGSSQPAASAEPDIIREALEVARNGLEWYRDRCPDAVDGSDDEADELIGCALASLDAAPVAQEPVAYLDLGAGGYMDVGTDLTDEQLAALPKGRHMLAIVGTYGVDGFTAAPVAQEPTDSPLPYEMALGELIDKIVPGLDTGDILTDARQASAALDGRSPVAQEPVGVSSPGQADAAFEGWYESDFKPAMERGTFDKYVARQAWFAALRAAPVAAQAQPVVNQQMTTDTALADTQRAIIEAAERRGYARAIAECGQDREDVHDIEAAAKTLAERMNYPWEPMSEQGREAMRKHAKRVIDAARAAKGES